MSSLREKFRKFRLALAACFIVFGTAAAVFAQASPEQLAEHQRAAQQAEARQDFATAVHEYRWIEQSIPDNAELKSNLGVALYFNHDLEQAAEVFRHAIALKPGLYTPHLFLGLAMGRLSHTDAAVLELKKAVALNPSDPLAHTWLGYEYTAQSNYQLAVEELKIAAQAKPDDPDLWFALGQSYLELGKQATTELIHAYPDGGRAWQLAAEQFEAQGNNGKAQDLYLTALKRRPDIETARARLVALGGTPPPPPTQPVAPGREDDFYRRIQDDEKQAREAFERVSQIDPDSYRAHQILGDAAAAADRYDEAIAEYKLVLERKPDLPNIHAALCNAMSRTARIQDAVRECEAELTVSPFSADAYVEAARVHLLEDDYRSAGPLLKKAMKLERPPIGVYKLMGKCYLHEKQYPDAIKAFDKYLEIETRDSSAYLLLARAYKYSGDTQQMNQAIAAYKRTSDAARKTNAAQKVFDKDKKQDEVTDETLTPDTKG